VALRRRVSLPAFGKSSPNPRLQRTRLRAAEPPTVRPLGPGYLSSDALRYPCFSIMRTRSEKVQRFLSRLAVVSLAFDVLLFGAAALNIGMAAEFEDKNPNISSLTAALGGAAVFFLVLSVRVWFPLPDRTFWAIAFRTLASFTFASIAAWFAFACLFNATVFFRL